MTKITHYEQASWGTHNGMKQEELQSMAKKIVSSCKFTSEVRHGYGTNNPEQCKKDEDFASILNGSMALTYESEIIEEKVIDADSVRMCCIKHNLYTKGTCRDYDFMLNFADVQGYSLKNLFEIASDICKHSEDQTVENVMFLLGKDAVKTFYHIKG